MAELDVRREALCVRVLWGERRLATHLVRDGQALALASNGELAPAAPALRFAASDGRFTLDFHDGLTGELLRNGETPLSLGEAVHRGLAEETPKGWTLGLGRADVVRVSRGAVEIEALRVLAPPKARGTAEPDYRFLNTLLLCLALFGAVAMNAELRVGDELEDDATSAELTRMRRIIVQTPKPEPVRKRVPERSGDEQRAIKRLAAVTEGRPRSVEQPRANPGGLAARELVGRIFGGPGASGVLGPGGLGKDLAGALGSVVAVNGDGNGGWSLRGNGAGGPNAGDPVQIGGIARSGVASREGIGRLCAGPGPCKSSAPPLPEPEPPLVCSNCMDKELIRKVIASHRDQIRYCYELALQQAPSLAGKVSVKFLVNPAGSVVAAQVEQNTTNAPLGECLVSRVRSWQFPAARLGAGYSVTYPFVFKPSGS
ncbi:MAG: TonB family protein [Myxococcota bacterium]